MMIRLNKYRIRSLSLFSGLMLFCLPVMAQTLGISGPAKVDAGGTYSYTATNSSLCSSEPGFDWIAGNGTLATSYCVASSVIKVVGTDTTKTAGDSTGKTTGVTPQVALPPAGGYNCSAYNSVTWNNVSTLTSGTVSIRNNCSQSAYLSVTIVPRPSGSITPFFQDVASGATPATITATASGGDGAYSYQWQRSSDGVTWTNISGATVRSYTPAALAVTATTTVYYRAQISSFDYTINSPDAEVDYVAPLVRGNINVSPAVVNSGGSANLINIQNASGGNCGGNYTYQWQESYDEINWTNLSSASVSGITQTTFFRRKVICGNDSLYSNTVRVKIAPYNGAVIPNGVTGATSDQEPVWMPSYSGDDLSDSVNYIRTREFLQPGVTNISAANALRGANNVHQTTGYMDGLGRTIQTVNMQSTPEGHDMITPSFYDSYGRTPQQYLSYSDGQNAGNFRTDPSTQQPAFYTSLYPGNYFFYTNTTYDNSPANQVLKVTAPGDGWTGRDVGTEYEERANSMHDSVIIWHIGYGEDSLPIAEGTYQPGRLDVSITTDENDNEIIQYKDKNGHIILKKAELSDSLTEGYYGWLCTYYVYDDLGNQRFIITPKALQLLSTSSYNWAVDTTLRNNLCFSYLYDEWGRLIMKQVPGGGKTYMVYDNRDRLVFSQDANLRTPPSGGQGGWMVNFYDSQNRMVMKAVYPSSATRATLQADMDAVNGVNVSQTYNIPAPEDMTVNQRDPSVSQYVARNSITFLPGFTSTANDNFTASINPTANNSTETVTVTNPLPNISGYLPVEYYYYDDYSWQGAKSFNSSYVGDLNAGGNPYPDAVTYSDQTYGMPTGTKVKLLNTPSEQWLTTTTYYDDKERPIQVLSDNISGGTNVLTSQYDFSGKVLSTYFYENDARSATIPDVRVLTMNQYDPEGRLLSITQQLNDDPSTKKVLAAYTYDELGRLKTKTLSPSTDGGGLETLNYSYNVRGWLTGINPSYVSGSTNSNWFGEALSYSYGFTQSQANGNIAGEIWKDKGDGMERAYGFDYDNADRLTKGDFTQNNSGTWNNSLGTSGTIDFSVNNLQYDANGNIWSMKQMGLKVNNAAPIDELKYQYNTNSNQLYSVTDTASDPNTTLGDFHDGTNAAGTADYSYDANGNLTKDLNKNITYIHYNYLNLPDTITVNGKGTIIYIYDAEGVKWEKIVEPNSLPTQTTTYIDGFIYQSYSPTGGGQVGADTLQSFADAEGRVRPVLIVDSLGYQSSNIAWIDDYFIKDHLGNVRMVLTDQTKEDTYAATMEPQNAAEEDSLFDNLSNTRVPTPPGFTNDPNDKEVSQLDGSDGNNTLPRVGPAIVLKVMAGDTITIATQAWYQSVVQPPPSGATNLLNDLLNALTGGVISNSHGIYNGTNNNPNTILSGDLGQFFTNDENTNYSTSAPKAFLNYVAFDNQLNMVGANSGVVQVPTITGSEQAQALVAPTQIIQKDGYLYIYVSNESAQRVFFDNLVIHHAHGPLLAETNYYPDGLTMAGISDQAMLEPGSRFKYQSKELDTALAVDLYDFGARYYDEQIGRFNQIDPASQFASGYVGMGDEWVSGTDPNGQWFLIDDLVAMGVGGGLNLLNAALSGKVHNFWSGFKYFAAGAGGAEIGLYLGPAVGFAAAGTLNVAADYSEGHIKGATLGQTILNTFSSFVNGGGSGMMGAEAGLVKASEIAFNRAWSKATAIVGAESIQPLEGQFGFEEGGVEGATAPTSVEGTPEGSMLNIPAPDDAGFFENPNGGTEPTLNLGTNDQIINNEGKSYNDLLKDAQEKYPNKAGRIELHHVDPKYMGGSKNGLLTPIDAAYHQMITNEFRNIYPYGRGYLDIFQRLKIMRQVYDKYPIPGYNP